MTHFASHGVNRHMKSRRPQSAIIPSSDANVAEDKHILAQRYKTKQCMNPQFLETGVCPYETRCMFAHGDEELRTTEDNVRDGLVTEEAIKTFRHHQAAAQRRRGALHGHQNVSSYPRHPRAAPRRLDSPMPSDYYGAAHEDPQPQPPQPSYYDGFHYGYEYDQPQPPAVYIHNPYAWEVLHPEDRFFHNCNDDETPVDAMYATDDDYGYPAVDCGVEYFPNAEVAPIAPSTAAAYGPPHARYATAAQACSTFFHRGQPYSAAVSLDGEEAARSSYDAPAPVVKALCTAVGMDTEDERAAVMEP